MSDFETYGTFVAQYVGRCDCGGGEYGHEQYCGVEYVGALGDEFSAVIMWDFSN